MKDHRPRRHLGGTVHPQVRIAPVCSPRHEALTPAQSTDEQTGRQRRQPSVADDIWVQRRARGIAANRARYLRRL